MVKVQAIDNLSSTQLIGRFAEARGREYMELITELQKLAVVPRQKRSAAQMSRLRARFRNIAEIDFFGSPQQKRVEELFISADASTDPAKETASVFIRTKTSTNGYGLSVEGHDYKTFNESSLSKMLIPHHLLG